MVKVLVANENVEQNKYCCKILSQNKDLKIIQSYNGLTTIDMYLKMHPSILILNTNISDINYYDVINKISCLSIEQLKCNILIQANNQDDLNNLPNNMSKVYYIFRNPNDYNNITKILNELKNKFEIKPLDEQTLNVFLISLGIRINISGTDYLKEAICKCYDDSFMLSSLKKIYSTLATIYHTDEAHIKDSMRNSLIPLNKYRSL